MNFHELDGPPPPALQRALEAFEATFLSPMGAGRFFRTSYGADRTAFIRSLGEGCCVAAERDGVILGMLEMAMVDLLQPTGEEARAIYIAEIKVLPGARRGITTARIMQKAVAWGRPRTERWFNLALDSTPVKPPQYTGRAGVPPFREAGRVMIVRLPAEPGRNLAGDERRYLADDATGEALYRRLVRGRYAMLGGNAAARSETPPVWLVHPSGLACGRLEDRRKVRQLIADDGAELRPAYLAGFAFHETNAAVDLLSAAVRRAGALGFRALRLCLPPGDLAALQRVVGPGVIQRTPGAVYTTAGFAEAEWSLSAPAI
jgi:hypothetical protein